MCMYVYECVYVSECICECKWVQVSQQYSTNMTNTSPTTVVYNVYPQMGVTITHIESHSHSHMECVWHMMTHMRSHPICLSVCLISLSVCWTLCWTLLLVCLSLTQSLNHTHSLNHSYIHIHSITQSLTQSVSQSFRHTYIQSHTQYGGYTIKECNKGLGYNWSYIIVSIFKYTHWQWRYSKHYSCLRALGSVWHSFVYDSVFLLYDSHPSITHSSSFHTLILRLLSNRPLYHSSIYYSFIFLDNTGDPYGQWVGGCIMRAEEPWRRSVNCSDLFYAT